VADFEQVWQAERAVTRIVYEYAARLDLGDVDGVGELFRYGAFRAADQEGGYEGASGVSGMFRSWVHFYEGSPRTKHVTTNLRIDVDDDGLGATCQSYFTVLQHVVDELPLQVVIAGRYRDRFEQRDGEWWIVDRLCWTELFGDLHAHMTQ
jgi:hypothetical protein